MLGAEPLTRGCHGLPRNGKLRRDVHWRLPPHHANGGDGLRLADPDTPSQGPRELQAGDRPGRYAGTSLHVEQIYPVYSVHTTTSSY